MWNAIGEAADGFLGWLVFSLGETSWRAVLWFCVGLVCLYGGWQALQPDLTTTQRAVRFGIPLLLVALAFLMPMPKKRT